MRVTWALLPLLLGPALADALDAASRPVQVVTSMMAWLGWVGVLVAALVPRALSLTVLRLAAPVPLLTAVLAAIAGPTGGDDATALAAGVAVAAAAVLPTTADTFVDGSSYGSERRFALATPPRLLLGPVPVAWLLSIAVPIAAAVALTAQAWVLGAVLAVVAAPGVLLGAPAVHRLSRRWLVFVPTGLVVHDHLALAEPVLVPRRLAATVGPAASDTAGDDRATVDLTLGAGGVALAVTLAGSIALPVASGLGRSRQVAVVPADRLVVAPLRPGAVMAEAGTRHFVLWQHARPEAR
jgi:hypothetical protein